jgi:hypothetical protein
LLLAQPQEMLSDNDQRLQGCGDVIAKSKQSGASPERSSYSIVFLSFRSDGLVANTTFGEAGQFLGEIFQDLVRKKWFVVERRFCWGFLGFWCVSWW